MKPLALAALTLLSLSPAPQPGILPIAALTPGTVRTTDLADICSHGTKELRYWSRERDDRILREYGLPAGHHRDWEIDHLIPLDVGGADDDRNLWAEPRQSIVPYDVSAEKKDHIEWAAHDAVCEGRADIVAVQHAFMTDWRTVPALLQ